MERCISVIVRLSMKGDWPPSSRKLEKQTKVNKLLEAGVLFWTDASKAASHARSWAIDIDGCRISSSNDCSIAVHS